MQGRRASLQQRRWDSPVSPVPVWQYTSALAAAYGHKEEVELLVARGADALAQRDRGSTPAEHARSPELKALLQEAAAQQEMRHADSE
jgi:hypothetical protein